jgi:hypothetical protein
MSPCNFVPGEKCSQPDTQGIVTCRLPAGDRGSFTQPIRPVVPPPSPLAMVRQFTGLTLPGDFETLLGDRAVIAFGGLELTSAPDVVVRSHPRDLSKARSLADRLRSTVARKTGVELAIRVSGDDLVVASNSRYADRVIAGGDVGAEKRFRAAMGAMPDQVSDAGYVDLSALLGLFGAPRRLRSLDSVGFWDRVEGGAISGQLRLVLR